MHTWERNCSATTSLKVICSITVLAFVLPLTVAPPIVLAQTPSVKPTTTPTTDVDALRKAAQNPVANLISVPFQNNTNFNVGANDRTQNLLNIQPVIPFNISKDWMVVTRVIQPIIWQPVPNAPAGGEFGIGDMSPTFFLGLRKPGKLIWGAGPVFVIPTATNNILGQGKFSVGPSIVALIQPQHWTVGALVNNVWSVAGSGDRPAVNQMLLQCILNYNLKKGWYFVSAPIITANWRASSGNVWTVPVGGGVGRIMRLGSQPVNLQVQFFGNALHPAGTSPWGMRLQITLLYPMKPAKPTHSSHSTNHRGDH